MTQSSTLHHRKSIRLKGFDYTQPGAYFVTIAAWQRSGEIEAFLTGAQDEVEIVVKNVALEELRTPPFRAAGFGA